jgi:DNA-binding NarL/FixJ family response regulator
MDEERAENAESRAIRVVVADASDLYREGLALVFDRERDLRIVGRARTSNEACEMARTLHPDVVLMDLALPGDGGLAATRCVSREASGVRVLLIARRFSRADVREAVLAGVRGFITKESKLESLIDAVRVVARGDFFLPHGAPALNEDLLMPPPRQAQQRTPSGGRITARELDVLRLLVDGATNRDIAERLGITENTTKVHLRNILDKLHLRNRQQAAAYAVSSGLVRPENPPEAEMHSGGANNPAAWRPRRRDAS